MKQLIQQADIERRENENMRIIIDKLKVKNEQISDKLKRLGVLRIPSSEIEKKIFYSKNDKILEGCGLIT